MKAEIMGESSGARFFRGDLHIHSYGGSHDVKDKTCTPSAIVAEAKTRGVDIIAIADHNNIKSIPAAYVAALKAGIFLVPAVELSTPQGHLLCYFPTLDALQAFFAKLTILDPGKDTCHCQQGMAECLDLADKHGGFGVFAHVDGGAGFETMMPTPTPHKRTIICHPALLGLELKTAASAVYYSDMDSDTSSQGARARPGDQAQLGTTAEPRARSELGLLIPSTPWVATLRMTTKSHNSR